MTLLVNTEGILISAITCFQPELSNSYEGKYAFSYKIRIENTTNFTVQLMRRSWQIYNAQGGHYQIEGEGVVGLQPILEPGQVHEYISGCVFDTPIGKMEGLYLFKSLVQNIDFTAKVPDLSFVAPFILN
jgi:ApaG protein